MFFPSEIFYLESFPTIVSAVKPDSTELALDPELDEISALDQKLKEIISALEEQDQSDPEVQKILDSPDPDLESSIKAWLETN